MSADGYQRPLSKLARAALQYAAFGWRVFPCEPMGKKPLDMCDECLAPLGGWTDGKKGEREKQCKTCGSVHEESTKQRGVHLATTDAAQIERWWRHRPDANIGLAMGGGLLAFDVDGDEGAASLAALVAQHGELPLTPTQRTVRGRHFLFTVPAGACRNSQSSKNIAPHIDTRGEGGYIVVAPSVRPNGGGYVWDDDARPSKIQPAAAPQWLVDALTAPEPRPQPAQAAPVHDLGRKSRSGTAIERYCQAAVERAAADVAASGEGTRNATLNRAGFGLAQLVAAGGLTEATIRMRLEAAALAAGLHKAEIAATLGSAIAAGLAAPRDLSHVVERPARARAAGATLRVATSGGAHIDPDDATHAYTRESVWIDGTDPDFVFNKEGAKATTSVHNIMVHLRGERALQGLFAVDEPSRQILVHRAPPWQSPDTPRLIDDSDITALCAYLETHDLRPNFTTAFRAVQMIARENMVNPILERLRAFEWDGTSRLDHWLCDYAGAPENAYTRAVAAKWLISACARIEQPGVKVDTMLVLEGAQGIGKSTIFLRLAEALGPNCYTDRLSDLRKQDAAIELLGNVIVEISELDALRGAAVSTIKAFLSRQHDKIRLPYDKTTTMLARACVFGGSVNPGGTGWLHDPTGGRRFWPVTVSHIDREGVRDVAPQLWAEAYHRYRADEEWWLTDQQEIALQVEAVSERYEEDVWAPSIDDFITGQQRTSTAMVLDHLGVSKDRQDQRAQQRVGDHLRRRGFERRTVKISGRVLKGFFRDEPWYPDAG